MPGSSSHARLTALLMLSGSAALAAPYPWQFDLSKEVNAHDDVVVGMVWTVPPILKLGLHRPEAVISNSTQSV